MFDLAGIVAQACLLGALPSFASFVPMIGATVGSTAAGSGAGTTFVVPPPRDMLDFFVVQLALKPAVAAWLVWQEPQRSPVSQVLQWWQLEGNQPPAAMQLL